MEYISVSFLLYFVFLKFSFADSLVNQKCENLKAELNAESLSCYSDQVSPSLLSKMKGVEDLNQNMQQWVWISGKANKVIQENTQKAKLLRKRRKSFLAASKGYPGGAKDEEHLKVFEEYYAQYENLLKATSEEAALKFALNTRKRYCSKGKNRRGCSKAAMADLQLKYAEKQASKLSILMTYPLLSSDKVQKNIRKELSKKVSLGGKGSRNVNRKKKRQEILKNRKNDRRANFANLMLDGIDSTKKALDKRQEKWKDFRKNGERIINQDLARAANPPKYQAGHAGKNARSAHKRAMKEFQKKNSKLINELLSGSDLDYEFQNPYLGKAICSMNKNNKAHLAAEKRNQMILDGALMVAPFFLGPLGLAARLASLGRVAGWGVKGGRVAIAGAVEGGLLYKDIADLSKSAGECKSLALGKMRPVDGLGGGSDEVSAKEKSGYESVEACKADLKSQILMAVGGTALAPIAFVGKSGKAIKGLSKKGKEIAENLKRTKELNRANKFFREQKLTKAEKAILSEDFKAFRSETGLKGEELMVAYKKRYQENFAAPVCSI